MTTPLTEMSLDMLGLALAGSTMPLDQLLAELRRRDALAASNAERERRLVEAARSVRFPITSPQYRALRAALAEYQEKNDD